jgi:hypothetical protein
MGEPFWMRSGLSGKQLTCGVAGASVVGTFVLLITEAAQRTAAADARADGIGSLYTYSAGAHVVAMVAVAALAVMVTVTLWRSGSRAMAGAVVVGAAAGPMAVVAAPIRPGLMAPTSMDTLWWWHVLVTCALTLLIGGWLFGLNAVRRRDGVGRPELSPVRWDASIFLVTAALAFTVVWNHSWQLQESPGALPALGWALLSAGLVVAAARSSRKRAVSTIALSVLTLLALSHAYTRPGGWPGVAGWELKGMESPVVLSSRVEVVLLAAGVLGLVIGVVRSRVKSRRTYLAPTRWALSRQTDDFTDAVTVET